MASNGYMTIKGSKQGSFKGNSLHPKRIDWIEFDDIVVGEAIDPATNQMTGRRAHNPIKIVKQIDSATPQLFQACQTSEQLVEVIVELVAVTSGGGEQINCRYRLRDAAILDIRQHLPPPGQHGDGHKRPLQDIYLGCEAVDCQVLVPVDNNQSGLATGKRQH